MSLNFINNFNIFGPFLADTYKNKHMTEKLYFVSLNDKGLFFHVDAPSREFCHDIL